jgi:hypothetical protein
MPDETTARIAIHYKHLGLDNGWPAERVRRLCQLVKCTEAELCALCLVTAGDFTRWMKANRIPPHVALHFQLLESAWWEATHPGAPQIPVMPVHLLT